MRRHLLPIVTGLVVLMLALPGSARVNPLRVITEKLTRSEILVVLDTSGSMVSHPSPAYYAGSDCGGDMAGWTDLCGDGMCTGSEGSSINQCIADCHLVSNPATPAGNPRSCNPSSVYVSRMYLTKRVLSNLLPDLRNNASFGLVTFNQRGYYRYYQALTSGVTEKVSVFFTQIEMEQLGAWDATNNQPRTSFSWNGTTYTLLSSAGMTVDKDSLYSRTDNPAEENRYRFSVAGRTYSDGFHTWRYKGSYFTYTQYPINTASYQTVSTYMGPQYIDSLGVRWVHNRFVYNSSNYIYGGSSGSVVVPLTAGTTQAAADVSLAQVMARLNMASNGGIWASGGTPTAAAIDAARTHFRARQLGNSPYTAPDPLAACRPRYVLLLTDGYHGGTHPRYAAANLYNDPTFTVPPKTIVVGLPGLPKSAMDALDQTADGGDDGNYNNASATAKFANNEAQLLRVVKEALFEMVRGDFTTTASGTTSSGTTILSNDVALVPSVEYPGWKGHLRAMDLTVAPPSELWDAGTQLNSMEYKNRKIFTGYPNSNSGIPVPLLANDGTVNWDGSCCGGVGVRHVWADVEPTLNMNDAGVRSTIISTVEWVVGKNRTWRLGPILRSTPATIGPPPRYRNVGTHGVHEKLYAARETLVYITSNDGILHAFRAKDGTEAFGYVPPNLWPQIRTVFQEGGHAANPDNFRWILASSPRVEDIPPQSPPNSFQTQLVITMGPGAKAWGTIDITNPSACSVTGCELNDPPFYILQHSRDWNMATVLGQTWSVPALFYDYNGAGTNLGSPTGQMAMGSGYGTGRQMEYYHYFRELWRTNSLNSKRHNSGGAVVDFAVLPDTAAAVNFEQSRRIIATYQADLLGRVYRYDEGRHNQQKKVIDAGKRQPIYYSPALYHTGGSTVLLTAVTLANDEESLPSGEESTIYMRAENGGTVDGTNHNLTCAVSDICSTKSGCPATVPSGCTAPSSRALPVSPPLILKNQLSGGTEQYEAYYLFYEPPSGPCSDGDSWLVRLATTGAQQAVISSTEYVGVRGTGLTVVGGGIDVVITQVGKGANSATATSATGNISGGALMGDTPYVEVWREVK